METCHWPCYIQEVDKSFQGLVLSLIAHILLWLLLTRWPSPPVVPAELPTEVTLIERDRNRGTFVTETEKNEQTFEKLKDTADYLSALTKRVKKQMVAKEHGPTRNSRLNFKPAPVDEYRVAGMQKRDAGEGPGLANPMGQSAMRTVAIGASSISEFIPGVQEGGFTALNTDQFTYYAFFNRVNEQVRNRWVAMIRAYVGGLSQEELQKLSASDRNSVVEIVLSKSGEFIRAVLHTSSSIKPLDQAATESFRMAAPFLNPPQGLVEADGFIHLRYAFLIRFRPSFGPGAN